MDHRRVARLDLAIGADQIEPVALPGVPAVHPQPFGRAPAKHVTPQPVTPQQARRRLAHGGEALKPQLQAQRQFLGARVLLLLLGQQHGGLEVGQPGRHHQIVGRQFQPQFPCPVDIGEILVDQREDGDRLEIDLLPPRKVEQQVQRPFPSVEFEIERLVLARRGGRAIPIVAPRHLFGQREQEAVLVHAAAPAYASRLSRRAISVP